MTKLAVFSDLHLEHDPDWVIPEALPDFDVAVVASDVHGACHLSVSTLARAPALVEKPVIFVPGNHELYGHILQDGRARGRKAAAGTSVHFLWQDVVTIAGVRFVGCPLWTAYELYGTRDISMAVASAKLNDHRMIRIRESGETPLLTPERAAELHRSDMAFLEAALSEPFEGPTVVVTHHLPSIRSIMDRFAGSIIDPAFASNLEPLIERFEIDLWIHGHSHGSVDYAIGRARVISNPKGHGPYVRRGIAMENPVFDPCLVMKFGEFSAVPGHL